MSNPPKREIIIAFGTERRNEQWRHWILESYLDDLVKKELARRIKPEFEYEYISIRFKYLIRFIFTKEDFIRALNTPKAIVIYIGHSRWGQGPSFDPKGLINTKNKCPDPDIYKDDNPWENHVRMGWDIASTACIKDIIDHCTDPKGYVKNTPPFFSHYEHRKAFRKALKKKKNLLKPLPKEVAEKLNKLGNKPLAGRYYWTTERDREGNVDYKTFVVAGNDDLRSKIHLKCSVLFMDSCSSLPRFYCALQNRRIDTKSQCRFYLTKKASQGAISQAVFNFVHAILERGFEPAKNFDGQKLAEWINMADKIAEKYYPKSRNPSGIVTFLPPQSGRKYCYRKWKTKP